MKQLKAIAIIKTAKKEPWVEDFVVDSRETAEDEVKQVVKFFNDTLKPGETERIFVKLDEVIEEDVKDTESCMVGEFPAGEDDFLDDLDDYEHDF